jgi:hypothetical protein
MAAWTGGRLDKIAAADELEIASLGLRAVPRNGRS